MSCRTSKAKTPCIYKITNIKNGKFYIGSCLIFSRRKSFHVFTLRRNIHCNKYLQRAWNKYGEENFEFEIVEYIEDKSLLIQREQCWIDNAKPQYNSRTIADSNLDNKRVFTEKERKESRERNKKFRKLTETQVRDIQNLREQGYTIKKLSKIYDIDDSAMSRLLSGKWYKEFYRPLKIPANKYHHKNYAKL